MLQIRICVQDRTYVLKEKLDPVYDKGMQLWMENVIYVSFALHVIFTVDFFFCSTLSQLLYIMLPLTFCSHVDPAFLFLRCCGTRS